MRTSSELTERRIHSGTGAWRRFAFFGKEHTLDVHDLDSQVRRFGSISYCELSTREDGAVFDTEQNTNLVSGLIFIGDCSGRIWASDAAMSRCVEITVGFTVIDSPSGKSSPFISTAREEIVNSSAALRARAVCLGLDKNQEEWRCVVVSVDSEIEHIAYHSTTVLGKRTAPPTCLSLNQNRCVVGFADGDLIVFEVVEPNMGLRKHCELSLSSRLVTNLIFPKTKESQNLTSPTINPNALFATAQDIVVYFPRILCNGVGTQNIYHKKVLDSEHGCDQGCAAYSSSIQKFCIARIDGIYLYDMNQEENEEVPLIMIGEKQGLAAVGRYLFIACRHEKSRRVEVYAYDLERKRVTHFHRLPVGHNLLTLAGTPSWIGLDKLASCFVLSTSSLIRLDEKPTSLKLQLLLRMNLYPSAIDICSLAGRSQPGDIADIYRLYGDHLFNKCDWDGATTQYIRTIGRVPSSIIIMRFLGAQCIDHLINYLEGWHQGEETRRVDSNIKSNDRMYKGNLPNETLELETKGWTSISTDSITPAKGRKNSIISKSKIGHMILPRELTSLLINCYAKLKDVDKIDDFVQGSLDCLFDVRTAVLALHDAGFYDHAFALADMHHEHATFAQIRLEQGDFTPSEFQQETSNSKITVRRSKSTSEKDKNIETTLWSHRLSYHLSQLLFTSQAAIFKTHLSKLLLLKPNDVTALLNRSILKNFSNHAVQICENQSAKMETMNLASIHEDISDLPANRMRGAKELFPKGFISNMNPHSKIMVKMGGQEATSRHFSLSIFTFHELIHHFVTHPKYLQKILIQIITQEELRVEVTRSLRTTLLELFLHELRVTINTNEVQDALEPLADVTTAANSIKNSNSENKDPFQASRLKPMEHIVDKSQHFLIAYPGYNKLEALVLVEYYRFDVGRIFLYDHIFRRSEKNKESTVEEYATNQILLSAYALKNDVKAMLRVCQATTGDSSLWLNLLNEVQRVIPSLSSKHRNVGENSENRCDDLMDVLKVIHDENAVPRQLCLQRCAITSHNITLSPIKSFLSKVLRKNSLISANHHRDIIRLWIETDDMRQQIHKLRTTAVNLFVHHIKSRDYSFDRHLSSSTFDNKMAPWAAFLSVLPQNTERHASFDYHCTSGPNRNTAHDDHRKWSQIKESQQASADDCELFLRNYKMYVNC